MWILRLARDARRLPGRERRLALRALMWLAAARIALHVTSFSRLLRSLHAIPPRRPHGQSSTTQDCRLALERASRLLPASTCLARALAGAALLRRDGHGSRLDIHVALDAEHRFASHASLTAGDLVIAGAGTEMQWSVLLSERIEP
jgi:transglutaminase superfamily protein